MFKLLGVTLLQPEALVAARMPGGAEAIGALLTALQDSLRTRYQSETASASRTLCLALGPGRPLELWLATDEGVASPEELQFVQELPRQLSVPEVKDGPVALALVFSIGAEPPPEAELCLPDEWNTVVKASDTPLSIDQILLRVWSSQG